MSFADLYPGKIIAALDRQQPRDLYDIHDLLAKEGMSLPLRRTATRSILGTVNDTGLFKQPPSGRSKVQH